VATAPRILVLHGPNLNLLGTREPEIYGRTTLAEIDAGLAALARAERVDLLCRQSNHEGAIVDAIHGARDRCAAIIINPGSLTHYAWSLHDALASFDGIIVEVHISNPNAREAWRHTSVVSPVATGTIAGFGGDGYRLAVLAVAAKLAAAPEFAARLLSQSRLRVPNEINPLALQEEGLLLPRPEPPADSAVPLSTLRPQLQFTDLRGRLLAAPR